MIKIAFLFPGQGSQQVGMGKDFFDASPTARQIYETFNRLTLSDLSNVCFNGPEETLKNTLYTQPAILATSLAALALFQERCDLQPALTAGHSLGEYGALYASGVIDLETAAQLIHQRANLMSKAPVGAMSAILGLEQSKVEAVIQQVRASGKGAICVANYNTAEQLVITGTPEAVEAAGTLLKESGAKRVLPLPVGGAFHSPLMDTAAQEFVGFVSGFEFRDARIPVITNVDAQPTQSGQDLRSKLADQINHSVRWAQTMERMFAVEKIETVIEFGPGKVLTGMIKKSFPNVQVLNILDMASLDAALAALSCVVAV